MQILIGGFFRLFWYLSGPVGLLFNLFYNSLLVLASRFSHTRFGLGFACIVSCVHIDLSCTFHRALLACFFILLGWGVNCYYFCCYACGCR